MNVESTLILLESTFYAEKWLFVLNFFLMTKSFRKGNSYFPCHRKGAVY